MNERVFFLYRFVSSHLSSAIRQAPVHQPGTLPNTGSQWPYQMAYPHSSSHQRVAEKFLADENASSQMQLSAHPSVQVCAFETGDHSTVIDFVTSFPSTTTSLSLGSNTVSPLDSSCKMKTSFLP